MDFLKFVATAVLSSAFVSAVLFAIISLLTPRSRQTNAIPEAEPANAQMDLRERPRIAV
jgi:hypothetical protein